MTLPEQGGFNELRERLSQIDKFTVIRTMREPLSNDSFIVEQRLKLAEGVIDEIVEVVSADRKQHELDARIDEQTHTQADIDGNVEYWPDGETVTSQLQRLLELEALRNKLKEKL